MKTRLVSLTKSLAFTVALVLSASPLSLTGTGTNLDTFAGGTVVIGSGAKMTDTAVLLAPNNPTGTITFVLKDPGNMAVYTNVVPVNGNDNYDTSMGNNPGGYSPSVAGTYLWTATYSGDPNNLMAIDSGQNENETAVEPGPNILANYSGLNFSQSGGFVPPDTCGAAGPSRYVETVNQTIALYSSKATGAPAITDSFAHFFFTTGGLSPISMGSSLLEPAVVYDELIGRFIVADLDADSGTPHVSQFLVAVSKTASPATLGTADWYFYAINTTEAGFDGVDPLNVGYNADAFVFTLDMFPTGAGGAHARVTAVNASDLASGSALNVYQTNLSSLKVRPATVHGSMAGDPMWLAFEGGDNQSIAVIKMTSVLSNSPIFSTTAISVNPYSPVVPPLNPNGSVITSAIDSRILKAAVANNILVATHHVSVSSTQDVVAWYAIDLSSGTPTLSQQGRVAGGNNTYFYYPAIDINASGDIGMTYMRSGTDSPGDYMSMYITGRTTSDSLGTMRPSVLVPAGTGVANYSDFAMRAGDLSGINVDPVTGSFWAANEYATSPAGSQSAANWGTAIANFTFGCPQGLVATVNDSVTGTGINQWDYSSGGWSYYTNDNFTTAYQKDEHYAPTTGTKAHFRFHGNQVKVYTVKEPAGGNIRYTLDTNLDVQVINNYSPTQVGNSLSYTSPIVNDGDHDLVVEVLGTHGPGTSNTITVDKAEVYAATCSQAQALAATINDNTTGTGDNQFDYTSGGWAYYTANNFNTAFQKDEHYAPAAGTKALFRFNGTQVKIYTVMEPAGGFIHYSLDNGALDDQLIDNYSPTQVGNSLSYTSPIIPAGEHTLTIQVNGTHNLGSSNTITIDKAEVYVPAAGPVLSATVNDSVTGTGNNQWDYSSGVWSYYSNPNFTTAFQMDEHYAFGTGVLAHFRFNGTQVKIYTVKEPAGGNIRYALDTNVDIQTVSNYSPTQVGNSLSYTSPVVSAGNHDLVIEVLGTHEPSASSNTITVDKAEVYVPACSPSQTFTGSLTGSDPTKNSTLGPAAGLCGPNSCPGIAGGAFHYDAYTFVNNSASPQCFTVTLNDSGCGGNTLWSNAYLGSIDPVNACANFLGNGNTQVPANPYSFTVPAGATFIVSVEEFNMNAGCASYTVTVSGFVCP